MKRIDITKTIENIDFGPETWEWLDLLGVIAGATQQEARRQEKLFIADTPYKKFLLCTIHKDIQTIGALYLLLRCEMIHQVASHVRLLCEGLITLQYVSLDPESRASQFWGYMDIEAYRIAESVIELEGSTADPSHLEGLKKFKESIKEAYEKKKVLYSYKTGRRRPFRNWCGRTIFEQAQECGPELKRLYELVYKQLSSYIHGSAWSLRRQTSYSRDHYQPNIVLNDIAAVIRTALVVWVEWAKFCHNNLGWELEEIIRRVPDKLNELETKHFPYETK